MDETFGTERLTGALLDRLTYQIDILEMIDDCYRLNQNHARKAEAST
ncbi:ATP-binding protein [Roseovarius nanhaiticus]|nr:ATP-binding protein [Roseovarius nanhaiticus]